MEPADTKKFRPQVVGQPGVIVQTDTAVAYRAVAAPYRDIAESVGKDVVAYPEPAVFFARIFHRRKHAGEFHGAVFVGQRSVEALRKPRDPTVAVIGVCAVCRKARFDKRSVKSDVFPVKGDILFRSHDCIIHRGASAVNARYAAVGERTENKNIIMTHVVTFDSSD